MKIKYDFVTNSSSTNFIVITNNSLNEEDFLNLCGIERDSPLSFMFEELYHTVKNKMQPAREYFEKSGYSAEHSSFEAFIRQRFSKHLLETLIEAEKSGRKVFIGALDSSDTEILTFFCCDSFELKSENIYFNAVCCAW